MKRHRRIITGMLLGAILAATTAVPAMADGDSTSKGPGNAMWAEPQDPEELNEMLKVVGEAMGEAIQAAAIPAEGGRFVDPSRPMVALTFDDGPQTEVENRIMDCLAEYGGRATFFLVGERIGSRREVVGRMAAEGHEVANHSMNHKLLQKQSVEEVRRQVQLCNDAIASVTGTVPTLMRLPGGGYNAAVLANVNMPMIQWSIDTLDWKTKDANKTVAAVLEHVKDGDIVLMHDLYSQSGDAALIIIPELTARGYQLVTVSEMAAAKGKTLQAGQLYSAFR